MRRQVVESMISMVFRIDLREESRSACVGPCSRSVTRIKILPAFAHESLPSGAPSYRDTMMYFIMGLVIAIQQVFFLKL